MKTGPIARLAVWALGGIVLAGCQHKLTLDEAQAQCEKKGGLMVVIYTQKITASGPGEQEASPGDCVATDKFGVPPEPPPSNR